MVSCNVYHFFKIFRVCLRLKFPQNKAQLDWTWLSCWPVAFRRTYGCMFRRLRSMRGLMWYTEHKEPVPLPRFCEVHILHCHGTFYRIFIKEGRSCGQCKRFVCPAYVGRWWDAPSDGGVLHWISFDFNWIIHLPCWMNKSYPNSDNHTTTNEQLYLTKA